MPQETVGLLDTSVVIDLMVCEPTQLPEASFIGVVTLAELNIGSLVARAEDEITNRQQVLQRAESTP